MVEFQNKELKNGQWGIIVSSQQGIFAQDRHGAPEQTGRKVACQWEGLSERLTAEIRRIYRKNVT